MQKIAIGLFDILQPYLSLKPKITIFKNNVIELAIKMGAALTLTP